MSKSIFAAMLVAASFVTASAQNPQMQINRENRTITISTSANVNSDAETAVVHIGFIGWGPDEASAYAEGSHRSNAIFKAVTDSGIAKKDIESESQSVAPVPDYENNNVPEELRKNRKFKVTQNWTVRCRADDATGVLHTAVQAGADNSGGVDWNVRDEDGLQARAAAKALTNAREVASAMASGLGVKLGALIYASNDAPAAMPVPRIMGMVSKSVVVSAQQVAPLAISPRRVEKSATVTAVFAIE